MKLLIRPTPKSDESIHGYILRAAEANGYKSPDYIYKLGGVQDKHYRSACYFRIHKIARLFGENQKAVIDAGRMLPVRKKSNNKYPLKLKIVNEYVNRMYTDVKHQGYCPECIIENGYIKSAWSLKYYIGCHEHMRYLVYSCPYCGGRINIVRRGMLRCSCGESLEDVKGKSIEDKDIIWLLKYIDGLVYTGMSSTENDIKYETSYYFGDRDINAIFHMAEKLGAIHQKHNDIDDAKNRPAEYNRIYFFSVAAKVLARFPLGYYEFLNEIRETRLGKIMTLKERYIELYNYLFRSKVVKKHLRFLQREFLDYENTIQRDTIIDKRIAEKHNIDLTIIGLNALAEELKINALTIQKLTSSDSLHYLNELFKYHNRYAYDSSEILPLKANKEDSISEREAARYIGIPVSVLNILRRRGIYRQTLIGDKINSYTKHDAEMLEQKIKLNIRKMPQCEFNDSLHYYLSDVLRMKLGVPDNKTDFIEYIINGVITPVGIINDDVARIVLDKGCVEEFKFKSKVKQFGVSFSDVATLIACDPTIVANMVIEGYLDVEEYERGNYVNIHSLLNFANNYVSCAWIANETETSTNNILALSFINELEITEFSRTHSTSRQPFINKADLAIFGEDVVNEYNACFEDLAKLGDLVE